ncbi:calcium/sodium antiporter [Haloferula rosea]|uniref:Calcium/sodium antiporter n=1 Tax=Haloferula rosea TaxID=490093 RepID=A0A934VFH2_9BACT|nr:calcium/sodium antiporter [Haloferula rosea]MBK1826997.1 calcium/sodium antiporter [Haloferula rosea]
MDLLPHLGWLVLGLALLSFGADWLVKGASEMAVKMGITPLVVGLTVVAFGTSAPELIVSLKANLQPDSAADLAVGNIVGSNVCNIALLLGLAALIRPFVVHSQVVKRELPILLVVTGGFVWMIWNYELTRVEGLIMASAIVVYVVVSIRLARANPDDPAAPHDLPIDGAAAVSSSTMKSVGWVILGLLGLIFGADRLVTSGVELATLFGVPQVVIGLTLVAIGTSLPELATTVAAARRGETDLIAGNLIGSNLFNILVVMGITSAVKPISLKVLNWVDLAVMSGFTLLLVPFLMRGRRLNRIEGSVMVVGYFVYCIYLVKPEWLGISPPSVMGPE